MIYKQFQGSVWDKEKEFRKISKEMKEVEADNSFDTSIKHDGIVNIIYDDPRFAGDKM